VETLLGALLIGREATTGKFSCEIRLGKWRAGDETLAQAWHRVQNRWTGLAGIEIVLQNQGGLHE
jgi:hypothetical protein